ncbi:MAG: Phosphate acyltransferase [Firmicutes bacterium]|nr:Phosphate acyltransferase [candidate division NPL-UPA2 bacterium]
MRIAIDALGGDHAPHAIVAGAVDAAREKDFTVVLVGPEAILAPQIASEGLAGRIEIVEATETISDLDSPSLAVRRKKQSSLVIAANLLRAGQVDAVVTAGNTGAFMAAGLLLVGRLAGIDRPALAPLIPTRNGRGVVLLDAGANMDAKPEHLLQYGVMGALYAAKVLRRDNPKVALLNVGVEESKGNQVTKDAYPLLKKASFDFVGNIEARELLAGQIDVVVCDGFTGNVLLKALEGMATTFGSMLKEQFTRDWQSKFGALLLRPSLRIFKKQFDYSEYGGAPLLGINGALVKCHGSSGKVAIKNGLLQAARFVEQGVVQSIQDAVTNQK